MRSEPQPTLTTARLVLRPLVADDAADVQRLAGARAIAETTLLIPHPYPDGLAESFIASRPEAWRSGEAASWGITHAGALVGCMGAHWHSRAARAEIGYWIAVSEWGRGFATEAARAVVRWTLGDHPDLEGIYAEYFAGNDASRRVLEKIGMREEGRMRRHVRNQLGVIHDIVAMGLLRDEFIDGT
jgi:[ribosomal protein S5]-alanine N-acetyltransferase